MAKRSKGYEGSSADRREDKRGAKQTGMSVKAYERSARDKREDRAGERKASRKRVPGEVD